jgi:hypothetical protein
MHASQLYWTDVTGWVTDREPPRSADLVLYFGSRAMLSNARHHDALRDRFPDARLLGCSTGRQMVDGDVNDERLSALALDFERTRLELAEAVVEEPEQSRAAGLSIGAELAGPDLASVFILSDGLHVNGSALVDGVASAVGPAVPLSGGLAGDGAAFAETLVGGASPPRSGTVAAVGFYGSAVQFGHGSGGGWDVFGPKRKITKASGNVLHEVDGQPALDLYKLYLGPEDSQRLPGSALLFPMRIYDPRHPAHAVVRTVLAVDNKDGSMTFAGDMPGGWTAQLMRGSFGRLCSGAAEATQQALETMTSPMSGDSAAILISCIGRRLLMGQRIDEEIEAVTAELPPGCRPIGFYSYGEIAPHGQSGRAQLHNQTMTVTLVSERAA